MNQDSEDRDIQRYNGCIEESGGALGLSSTPGQGVEVRLRFPPGQV